jgi:hypothetical protein
VAATKITYHQETVDLPESIARSRDKLLLKPNDDYSDRRSFFGWEMDEAAWDRALKQAMRSPHGVQERVTPSPPCTLGYLRQPGVQGDAGGRAPARLLGQGTELTRTRPSTGNSGFSSVGGLAPTLILDNNS